MKLKYLIGGTVILAIFLFGVMIIFISFNAIDRYENQATPGPTKSPINGNMATPKPSPTSTGNLATPKTSPTSTGNMPTPTPTPVNLADRIRSEMPNGNIVYDPPASMNLDDTKLVNLILGPNKTVVELEEMIPDKKGRQILDDNVQWYGYMQAEMSGTDFDITPVTSAKQLVSKQDVTKWSWSVKPKKPGKQTLYLTLYALVNENGAEKPLVIRPFDPKVIEVEVTFYQRAGLFLTTVGSHMEWVLTGIIGLLIPFALWIRRRKNINANGTSDSNDDPELREEADVNKSSKPAKPKKLPKQKPRKE